MKEPDLLILEQWLDSVIVAAMGTRQRM